MRKIKVLVIFIIIPFVLGYFVAMQQAKKPAASSSTEFYNSRVLQNDRIILAGTGNIFTIDKNSVKRITQNQNIIEPIAVGDGFAGVEKEINYSSLLEFDKSGKKTQTLFNGNAKKIDDMSWISDPSVNYEQNKIAYVSDKDKTQTGVPDNALYVLDLSSGKSTNIAKPDPYSGGIAHPIFDPANSNIIIYDYYQYDPRTLNPYSTIMEFDNSTGQIFPLTTDKQNAYQAAFSPDGKRLMFLIRDPDNPGVSLYVADFTSNGLANEQKLSSGDLSYPAFSNTSGYIYYLYATGNKGYNLFEAKIWKKGLTGITPVTNGALLQGNSSFTVGKIKSGS